ncbi:MAG: PilZ domain-containing protein [Rhodospirillaceae bacterium]|nr:PilZ domain-containing protein [Rhodospirillaceae bacterium]MBT7487874.1 PilZ domain-containing protein [Rhodospirillales bacterium]MBT4702772.1 PilZ domain-containing protein [Rhodospirillaceae bacterium]MBT5033835.1 PilZ domain-containing protein [Rhodospirillaceae bacterium]MBT6220234.1 PilZ domain-containing protein [Rhodospirillaceae bacterium]
MSVSPVQNNLRRYPRYADNRKVRVKGGADGSVWEQEGSLDDISGSGASVRIDIPMHNNAFVDMHVQGVGPVKGNVVRAYDGGAAVEFEMAESKKEQLANSLAAFNKNVRRGGY